MSARFTAKAASAGALAVALTLAGCVEGTSRGRPAGPEPSAQPEAEGKAAAAPGEEKLVPLKVRLPRPGFGIGPCPPPPNPERLEKPTGRPRPPFMVPVGTRNVALVKTVTSSDRNPIYGEPGSVTDGDKEARSYVILHSGPQYVQVDLGSRHRIHAVLFWLWHEAPVVFHDVVLQVADDADLVTGVKTLFSNDGDNSLGLGVGEDREYYEVFTGRLVDAGGVKARYVRLYSDGSNIDDRNRYTEVEVYGRAAD